MTNTKPGRPARSHLTCFACKVPVPPKEGDWFFSPNGEGQQVFVCRTCERAGVKSLERVVRVR